MQILRENEEKLLEKLLEEEADNISLNGQYCKLSELEHLEKLGYIRFIYKNQLRTNFLASVSITVNGKCYFDDKNKYLQEQQVETNKVKKAERKADIKFIISTSIAVIALVVSILSFCIKL